MRKIDQLDRNRDHVEEQQREEDGRAKIGEDGEQDRAEDPESSAPPSRSGSRASPVPAVEALTAREPLSAELPPRPSGALTLRRNIACQGRDRARARHSPLYIGGFLGPFGGGVVAVLVPQLRDAFDATTAGVALSIPAYLVPFAALQLVSGTLGERLGRRRVVRTGYIAYAVLSLLAALAPTLGAFLVVRALQGSRERVPDAVAAGRAGRRGPAAADREGGRDVRGGADLGGGARAARRRCAGRVGLAARVRDPSLGAVGLAMMPPADGAARDEPPRAARGPHPPRRAPERGGLRGYAG